MSKKIISLGLSSKKLFFPFLLALTQIIFDIFNEYYPEKDKDCTKNCEKIRNNILDSYSWSIGGMLIIIVPHIKIFSDKNEQYERKIKYSKCKIFVHYFILSLFSLSIVFFLIIIHRRIEDENITSPHLYGLCTREGIEIICLILFSYLFLNYKFFIHNIISSIFFCIICLSIDLILKIIQEELEDVINFILETIIYTILESGTFIYFKYMMEKLYYSPFKIYFFLNFVIFIIVTISLSFALILGKERAKDIGGYYNSFYEYFDKVEVKITIIKYIIATIFNFFLFLFKSLTVYHLTPSHLLISFGFSKMTNILLIDKGNAKYYCIMLFILQIIFLLIFLEIIELNFCGLSDNIKKNIAKRADEDMNLLKDNSIRDSIEEIAPGYIIHKNEKDLEPENLDTDTFLNCENNGIELLNKNCNNNNNNNLKNNK